MNKNIVIIHYNTPYLTECLVRSINLYVKDAIIYVFDNSNKSPFNAKFDNVKILDNTKGQIINFKEWLKKYPQKNMSPGRVNEWGSAKHCYSVEKCMDLIKENFILLDSDVLLKRDISNLFINDLIYVGEVVTQPNSSIKRVLPFLCFINVEMCKKNNVHYFDDRYMHGLHNIRKNASSDKYDTGAGFYLNSKKLKSKVINLNDYIIHYGHGSWDKKGESPKYDAEEWAALNKKYWSMEKNKKVIYTCITGSYDYLIDPTYVTEGFDYVCFTDNVNFKSNIWEIRSLPKETDELSQVKKQRYVKIMPHKHLSEYDLSIWVDGNVSIKGNLDKLLENTLKDDISIYVPEHPSRRCIYKEQSVVISMRKDTKENIAPQIERYKKECFPADFGLLQSNILIRKHNENDCIKLMEKWFEEVKNHSHRDQLSFNYVLWKCPEIKISYMRKDIYKSEWFKWNGGHSKTKKATSNTGTTANKIEKSTRPRKTIEQLKKDFEAMINKKRRRKIITDEIGIYKI